MSIINMDVEKTSTSTFSTFIVSGSRKLYLEVYHEQTEAGNEAFYGHYENGKCVIMEAGKLKEIIKKVATLCFNH